MRLIDQSDLYYFIRYTITLDSIPYLVRDTIWLLETFKNAKRIVFSVDYKEFSEQGHSLEEVKEYLKVYFHAIYERYQVPLCEFVCDVCQKCQKDLYLKHYYLAPEGKTYDVEAGKAPEFYHFTGGKSE